MKNFRKIVISALLITSLFTLISCNKKSNDNVVTAKKGEVNLNSAEFPTQTITIDNWSFEIPSTWEKLNTEAEDAYSYAPNDLEAGSNTSNVNVVIKKSDSQPSLKDIIDNIDEAIVAQIVEVMPSATNFKYDDLTSNSGDVLFIEYDASNSGIDMHTTQYLVLANGYSIAVTSININDNIQPSPEDVAKNIVKTLKNSK